jgi:hypothetical protein
MTEQMSNQQFLGNAEIFIEKIRDSLLLQTPTSLLLDDSLQAMALLKQNINGVDAASFRSIVDRLEVVFVRHLTAQTTPSKIELETVELAVDWLAQLAILHAEALPEPKSLVAELLYAFDLVEYSQDAVALAALVAEHAEKKHVDPFSGDPEFDLLECSVPAHCDPFADDPGFGLEFDLLQRTINFVVETRIIAADPFSEDPSVDSRGDKVPITDNLGADSAVIPYDFFAGDPPLADNPGT